MNERFWPPLLIVCWPLASAGGLPHPAVPAIAPTWPSGTVPPSAIPAAPRNTTALAAASATTILLCRDMAGSLVLMEHRCPLRLSHCLELESLVLGPGRGPLGDPGAVGGRCLP